MGNQDHLVTTCFLRSHCKELQGSVSAACCMHPYFTGLYPLPTSHKASSGIYHNLLSTKPANIRYHPLSPSQCSISVGIELVFSAVAHTAPWFWFVARTALLTQKWFSFAEQCLHHASDFAASHTALLARSWGCKMGWEGTWPWHGIVLSNKTGGKKEGAVSCQSKSRDDANPPMAHIGRNKKSQEREHLTQTIQWLLNPFQSNWIIAFPVQYLCLKINYFRPSQLQESTRFHRLFGRETVFAR